MVIRHRPEASNRLRIHERLEFRHTSKIYFLCLLIFALLGMLFTHCAIDDMHCFRRKRRHCEIVFVVDTVGWAQDFKTDAIIANIPMQNICKIYEKDLDMQQLARAKFVIFYYWWQLERTAVLHAHFWETIRGKLVIGVCSHREIEDNFLESDGLRGIATATFANNPILFRATMQKTGLRSCKSRII